MFLLVQKSFHCQILQRLWSYQKKNKNSDLDIISALKRQKDKKDLKVAQHPSICSPRQPQTVPSVPPGSVLERDIMEPRHETSA